MTTDQIKSELEKIASCGMAVLSCREKKLLVFEANTYQPNIYGNKKFAYQCQKCFRKSKAVAQVSNPAEAIPFNQKKLQEIDARRSKLYEQVRESYARQSEENSREWWAKYEAHLRSPEWQEKRRLVLKRCDGICEGCANRAATQVHHTTYENLGNELLFQLVGLCDGCHELVHRTKKGPTIWPTF